MSIRGFSGFLSGMKNRVVSRFFLLASVFCAVLELVLMLLYYQNRFQENGVAGILWLASMILLILAFTDRHAAHMPQNTNVIMVLIMIMVVYFISHLYRYHAAPWNNYGLFDDAAWDIFLSKQKCFRDNTFEIIFWDDGIGRISRELLFHYYISILFRLFGYNLAVFNAGLIILGAVTVLFTAMLAYRMTGSLAFTISAGLILNFLPMNFTQVFMGHRYAMCGPMMVISLYFVWTAMQRRSAIRAVTGGIFAGFAMESAIMGKQYLWGLIAAGVISLILYRKRLKRISETVSVALTGLLGYCVACVPLYAYIWTHPGLYRAREADLTREFFGQLRSEGFHVIADHMKSLAETVFAPHTFSRQFSVDYPVLTWYLCILAVIGIVIAVYKGWILLPLMVCIPMAGNVVAQSYDFRLLITAPYLALLISLGLYFLSDLITSRVSGKADRSRGKEILLIIFSVAVMISPVHYILGLIDRPDSEYLLNHADVAVSRYIQDVVVGEESPNILMKRNEFNRENRNTEYDTLAATKTSYAHVHAYLEPYDSRRILSLFGDFPYVLQDEIVLRESFYQAVRDYEIKQDRDLVLVFEYDDKISGIVDEIMDTGLAEMSYDEATIDDRDIVMVKLRIRNADIGAFQEKAADFSLSESGCE